MGSIIKVNSSKVAELSMPNRVAVSKKNNGSNSVSKIGVISPAKQSCCDWFLEKIQKVWQAILYVLCCKCCWKEDKKQSAIEDKKPPKKEILPLGNQKDASRSKHAESLEDKKEIPSPKKRDIAPTVSATSRVVFPTLNELLPKTRKEIRIPTTDLPSISSPKFNLLPSSPVNHAEPVRLASSPKRDLLQPSSEPLFTSRERSPSPTQESEEAAQKEWRAKYKGVQVGTTRFGEVTASIFKGTMPLGAEVYRFFDDRGNELGYVSFEYHNEGFRWRYGDEPFDKVSHISVSELFNHEKGKIKLLGKAALEIIFRESIIRGCKGVVKVDASYGSKYFYFSKGHYITHPDKNFQRPVTAALGAIYEKLSNGTPLDAVEQQVYEGRKAELIKQGIAVEKLTPETICNRDETQLIKDQLAKANGQRIPASDALWMCLTNDEGGIDWWWNEVETNPLVDIPSLQIKR